MIWFTSDTHFGHANIIRFCKRPFETVQVMDECLIANWNARVGKKDDVYHLGDFAFHTPARQYFELLNGRIHFCFGNHDKPKELLLLDAKAAGTRYVRHDGDRFFLSHYAHRVWPNSHRGTYHLYGHSHGELPGVGRSMDVGIDAVNGYAPISIESVVRVLKNKENMNHHPIRNDPSRVL